MHPVTAPRFIRMPGPPSTERIVAVPAGSLPIVATLPAGLRLLDAVHALLASRFESACLTLSGGALHPFAYVIPALSPDADHAAFYSDVRRPPAASRLETGALTVGFREGLPFFHCHALWTEPGGQRGCGHVLPDETIIAEPIAIRGAGIIGARFEVLPDPETGFSLFTPVATGTIHPPQASRSVALRLAPNQDLTTALESTGTSAGFARARVEGGVASIIEARFIAAPPINGFATELLLRHGTVRCTQGPKTALDVAIVDFRGTIGEGHLVPGDNPVLMTFEGLLVEA